jgi:hypothetical protein
MQPANTFLGNNFSEAEATFLHLLFLFAAPWHSNPHVWLFNPRGVLIRTPKSITEDSTLFTQSSPYAWGCI